MTPKRVSRLLFLIPVALAFASNVNADSVRVTGPTDYWFYFAERSLFSVRTFDVAGSWSDPMLWLYDQQGVLQAANDDYYGLQSRLELTVEPGMYRLRAGVCCGDPDRWYSGVSYDVSTNVAVVPQTTGTTTTTTVETTTTQQSTTTTAEPTTTSVESTTTSVAETTTTVEPSTTTIPTVPELTTTTSSPPTTTTLPPQTAASTSTSSSLETTTTTVAPTTTVRPTTTTALPPVVSSTTSTTTTLPPVTTTFSRSVDAILSGEPVTPADVATIAESVDELTDQQLEALSETLSVAPPEVKKTFEAQVNVYSGKFDSYVPTGSKIPVGQRRVLVAIGAVTLASAGAVRRKL